MLNKYNTQKNKKVYSHISRIERTKIEISLNYKKSVSEIATKISKHRSTIYRELKRNIKSPDIYNGSVAHKKYLTRIKEGHNHVPLKNKFIREYVTWHLKRGWSP